MFSQISNLTLKQNQQWKKEYDRSRHKENKDVLGGSGQTRICSRRDAIHSKWHLPWTYDRDTEAHIHYPLMKCVVRDCWRRYEGEAASERRVLSFLVSRVASAGLFDTYHFMTTRAQHINPVERNIFSQKPLPQNIYPTYPRLLYVAQYGRWRVTNIEGAFRLLADLGNSSRSTAARKDEDGRRLCWINNISYWAQSASRIAKSYERVIPYDASA